jgi:hypothetical protein
MGQVGTYEERKQEMIDEFTLKLDEIVENHEN